MKARLAAALLLAIASGVAATSGSPDVREFPDEGTFELDGTTYFYAMGVYGSHTMVLGDGTAADALPFDGCAFVMLHPGSPNGRVIVRGLYANVTAVDVYVEDFRLEDGTPGYGADVPLEPDGGPAVTAVAAASGNTTLRVAGSRYFDPMTSTGDPMVDRDSPKLVGTLFVSESGLRDDETGDRLLRPAREDPEMHLRIRSVAGGSATSAQATFQSVGSLPDGSTMPTDAYGQYHFFNNIKFGGTATLDIQAEANAPPGLNELSFAVFSPQGTELGNVSVAPSVLGPDTASVTVPLLEFGAYTIAVNGSMAFGSYTINLREDPPPSFELDVWWENVTYGNQAYEDFLACEDAVKSPHKVAAVDGVVGRPPPPRFLLKYVVIGVVGGITIAGSAIKLLSDQVSLSAFRKAK